MGTGQRGTEVLAQQFRCLEWDVVSKLADIQISWTFFTSGQSYKVSQITTLE